MSGHPHKDKIRHVNQAQHNTFAKVKTNMKNKNELYMYKA
jgi:hypothetical protein